MRIMCVDNSKRDLHRIMKCCLKAPQVSDVVGFTTEKEALTWLRDHPCSLYGDVEGGIRWVSTLAANAKELCPEIAVIFVTDDEIHTLEAFELHAKGYLLKTSAMNKIVEEIEYMEIAIANRRKIGFKKLTKTERFSELGRIQ